MNKLSQVSIAPTLKAPVGKIRLVKPKVVAQMGLCESHINCGLFFDGTNNQYEDAHNFSHTNIARLHDTYKDDRSRGFFRVYVPGVGCKFQEIAEYSESSLGSGFGHGCEGRAVFAMLSLINSLHEFSSGGVPYFTPLQVRALCSVKNRLLTPADDLFLLKRLGVRKGLLIPGFFETENRDDFLREHLRRLQGILLKNKNPKIKECFLDVFGFSRGAAVARVFCHWIDKLTIGGTLAGIPLTFRFIGIIDTVASAGVVSGLTSRLMNDTNGHTGWAAVEYLRLPESLENCVHMVAMHELRRNFPLDHVGVDGKKATNAHEIIYPGAHSDVGGGYKPGELGISVSESILEADSLKLSQIPLNHMFECACAAGAPMVKDRAFRIVKVNSAAKDTKFPRSIVFNPFLLSDNLKNAYEAFLLCSSLDPKSIHEWMQPYLNWRWQNRHRYDELLHVHRASPAEKKILQKFNRTLISDADLIDRLEGHSSAPKFRSTTGMALNTDGEFLSSFYLDEEARHALRAAKNAPPVPLPLQHFFDNFVHDSLAGFDSVFLEPNGYWRYRKGFVGRANSQIVSSDEGGSGSIA